jgi:hypothetical protein
MIRGIGPRPGWDRLGASGTAESLIAARRWRILEQAQPAAGRVPLTFRTPEQFVDWLSLRLRPGELRAYFRELETIAREICDLELYRFARRYLGRAPRLRQG